MALDDSIWPTSLASLMAEIAIDGKSLTLESALAIAKGTATAYLPDKSRDKMQQSRDAVEKVVDSNEVVYGINTGFGAMSSVSIEKDELEILQANLVRSHACGIGERMDPEIVLLMMIIRANSLARGVSGARPDVVELILSMANARIAPIVPRIGSLGASGDLAPLSHMTLGMMGEGECQRFVRGSWHLTDIASAFSEADLTPIKLQAKEGLSLINGTSQMCAFLTLTVLNMETLALAADASIACSLEAIRGSHKPFDRRIHDSRPQLGQSISAARISELVSDSEIMLSHVDCDRVQDAYCFRCSPQVHGPVIDLLREVRRILEIEINSATDNPLVFVDDYGSAEIISGGNFHGQNLSLASDSIAIACHELASISERRINQLMDPNWSGQKAFLAKNEGLESGLMIVQYVAAAVIAELHLLANPASTSNVPVSMGKEDHVSMGATGTFRALQSSILLSQVLANELVCSAEALDGIAETPGAGVGKVSEWVRKHVDGLDGDRSLTKECENLSMAILDGGLTSIFG
ncbi:MAG: histidine ammonia-lyase [Candidatus Thalassarchaeaceae archaeon]|nr:histidine ammonia-lyase [Candidatus Thalassarchaeaceae archaeon]